MLVGNLIKCEKCKAELQPEDISITTINNELIRKCRFCGNEEEVN